MQQLTLGRDFNQPIDDVVWPPSLQQLTFGHNFNQFVDIVIWPTRFRMLRFGTFLKFQMHPIGQLGVGVSLATNKPLKTSLLLARSTQLTFDSDFNMPMNTIVWSDSIRELTFGLRFNQSIENVK